MDRILVFLILIPLAPLVAAIVIPILAPRLLSGLKSFAGLATIGALAVSFLASIALVREVSYQEEFLSRTRPGSERVVVLWTWANVERAYEQQLSPPADTAAGSTVEGGSRDFAIEIALRADALTAMMLAMVTFVSLLVAIFATGYMAGDRGYWRFFAYISLFVFSMTMLVSASNFLLLYVFWEAVGVCSYFLIGFWYEKPTAVAAGKKAFLVNRVGDFGFALALFLIWITYGTLNYHTTVVPSGSSQRVAVDSQNESLLSDENAQITTGVLNRSPHSYRTGGVALAICLLLMLGACGKSAQFPLHVWLPDAMEGPTPVSALIHAATMVTAGVYMVTRCSPLFMASPEAQLVVAGIGAVTALMAALIALTQFDLKRVLAYSTISQLGYMFLGLGAGTFAGITGGMFHLFTHAFFKALLFLGAGSVMHAMGNVIDMRKFGGLRRIMPITHRTFLVGCLALAGIFPLSGFWSKDTILGAVHDRAHELAHAGAGEQHVGTTPLVTTVVWQAETTESAADHTHRHAEQPWLIWKPTTAALIYGWLYWIAVFTAGLTAFYTFRAFYLTFYGETYTPPEAHGHAHESPPSMTVPLIILAVCAAVVGLILDRSYATRPRNDFSAFLASAPSLAHESVAATGTVPVFHTDVALISTFVALLGIALAAYLYLGEAREVSWLTELMRFQWHHRLTGSDTYARLSHLTAVQRFKQTADRLRLGWLARIVGRLLWFAILILTAPLIIANFASPYRISANKFFFDELYDVIIVRPLRFLAQMLYALDRWVVDGTVNAIGRVPVAFGGLMRSLQMGLVQFYALSMALGILLLILVRVLWGVS